MCPFDHAAVISLTLGPAGSSKTVNFAVPVLCHLDLPIIATDLKGTLTCMTKKLREKHHKQKTFCVNPAKLFINILDELARYNGLHLQNSQDAEIISLCFPYGRGN